jgi:hypothetical protein
MADWVNNGIKKNIYNFIPSCNGEKDDDNEFRYIGKI